MKFIKKHFCILTNIDVQNLHAPLSSYAKRGQPPILFFAKSIYFLSLEIPRQDLLTRKNLLIILQVSLQQLRRIQTIRALAHAVAAVEAVLDLHHLRLYLRCELEVGRGSSEKQGHSRAGVDLDPGRTWHTVAAGTAEASE